MAQRAESQPVTTPTVPSAPAAPQAESSTLAHSPALRKPGRATDEFLMQELAQGSHDAFEELLSRYEAPVLTFCYAFLRNREAAEDIAQEAFMRVFRNARRYQPVAKFTTWLYKIAANLCINELKKGKLRSTLSLDEPAGPDPEGSRVIERIAIEGDSPLTELERGEAQTLIGNAIEHLPPDQRTTLIMVEYHQMPYQDIAEILEVSVSAIKMRVKRARETLRETLKVLKDGR